MSTFSSVSDALELLVEPFDGRGDWDEILRRAGTRPERALPRRRTLVLALVVVAGVVAATAFATGLADRFSSWISGTPGRPAPTGEQRGFERRNRIAYASFPPGTTLRLLLRRSVTGTTFSLLGFRNGDAYCLRLIRANLPNGIGRNECLRAGELDGIPALVANDVWFSVGNPAHNVTGVYGFASDDVRAMVIRRMRGSERVPVVNNVFLALRGQPAGTVQRHPPSNPVLTVTAAMRNGRLVNIPFVAQGEGVFRGGRIPSSPSYFGRGPTAAIPGPTRVTAPIAHPRIGWLERREERGAPLPSQRFLTVPFGRVIQPDPDNPIRIGVGTAIRFGPPGAPRPRTLRPQGPMLCVITFQPLARASGGAGCMPKPFEFGPLALGGWLGTPIVHFNGLAADGIARVTAYLASGRTVDAALRDNVFAVAVPQGELPGRLVGYDAAGRVAGIRELLGNAVVTPCPAAVFARRASDLPAPRRWEQIDLATMRVAGQEILGQTREQVAAILGRPARILGNAQRTNGVAIPEYRYGGGLPATVGLSVQFVKDGDAIRANALWFQSPSLVDRRLGHVLRLQPAQLQRAIVSAYGGKYRLYLGYGSDARLGCTGSFRDRGSRAGIGFGLNPHRPSRPYLSIRANGGG
ncbi:MAG TPA: hypothetical protein VGJ77_22575 [Gaiellaceae bacterium]